VPFSSDEIKITIDRWAGPIRYWLVGRCESPDDVVQEVFCRLVQQPRMPERPSAWLFQVAANLVREEARRKQRRNVREKKVAVSETIDPSDAAMASDLRAFVAALPSDLRETIVLRIWGELTLEEIAHVLGTSTATVHRKYHQALNRLRQKWNSTPNSLGERYEQHR
jgi:RNA polymerase sigma-70 factor (ECF subfamily)